MKSSNHVNIYYLSLSNYTFIIAFILSVKYQLIGGESDFPILLGLIAFPFTLTVYCYGSYEKIIENIGDDDVYAFANKLLLVIILLPIILYIITIL